MKTILIVKKHFNFEGSDIAALFNDNDKDLAAAWDFVRANRTIGDEVTIERYWISVKHTDEVEYEAVGSAADLPEYLAEEKAKDEARAEIKNLRARITELEKKL